MEFLKNLFRKIFGSKDQSTVTEVVSQTKVEEPISVEVAEDKIETTPLKTVLDLKTVEEIKSTAKEIKAKIKKPATSANTETQTSDKPKPKRKRPSRSKKPKNDTTN